MMLLGLLLGVTTRVLRADLPVHCLRHQVVGEWRFILGPLSPSRSSCGHQRPDVEDAQPERNAIVWRETTQLMMVLKNPNVATDSRENKGHWTMIYDEGFEVSVGSLNFFAFSNFTFAANATTGNATSNVSHCGDTMVGWYQNVDRTGFGCYYGTKLLQGDDKPVEPAKPEPTTAPTAAPTTTAPPTMADKMEKVLDHETQKNAATRINMLQLGWTARPMSKWMGRTVSEVNSYLGLRRSDKQRELRREMLLQQRSSSDRHHHHARSFLQRGLSVPAQDLPVTFDWSNVNGSLLHKGINFLEPVMDQQECGSCYAVSSTRMLTARHRIAQRNTSLAPWSINFPLFCSEYNQGCKGGYSILNAKWSRDVGLLPENCMQYSSSGTCRLECDIRNMKGPRYHAANHRYVGSWYGNSTDRSIQEELYRNGPLVLGLEPSQDFMFYAEGVYKTPNPGAFKMLSENGAEWQQVDHAVLVVGWGEDHTGQKYWRVQNSWGEDWGENGFFRIARGSNEAGIETSAEAADVEEDVQQGAQVEAFFRQLPVNQDSSSSSDVAVEKHTFL